MDTVSLPRALGRFRLEGVLGRGAYGTVYRARLDGPLGFAENVALKVLPPEIAEDKPEAVRALADEARILSRLRHPNVVGLRGFEQIRHEGADFHVLALEYVEGVTLSKILTVLRWMGRSLPKETVLLLMDETLAGLAHAHAAEGPDGAGLGLVHRDLKPSNLMVDRKGSVRLLDFGIAKASRRLVQTRVGITKGTPPWMSPEQVRGQDLDARSDLWVLATLVYRMVAGRYWVEPARERSELLDRLQQLVEVRWADRLPDLRPKLCKGGSMEMKRADRKRFEDLLQAMLRPDPEDRPDNADAVRQELAAMSCWDAAAGRGPLLTLVEGLMKGQASGPPGAGEAGSPDSTRAMQPDEVVTAPGARRPEGTD